MRDGTVPGVAMRVVLAVAVLVASSACSSDGAGRGTNPLPSRTDGESPSPSAGISVPVRGDVTVPIDSIAPPPDGIPGVDASDALCREVARLAGTSSLLDVSLSFGEMSEDGAWRTELISAPVVIASIDAVEAALSDAASGVSSEDAATMRSAFVAPRADRADAAIAALRAAGADDSDVAELFDVWLDVLRTDDQLDPAIAVPALSSRLDRLIADATVILADQALSYLEDERLLSTVPVPSLERHLSAVCPETLGLFVGDAV